MNAEEQLATEFRGTRVLLVDDDEISREIALCLLEDLGFGIDTAENGLRAVELATINDYGLALMDVQMPVMDGLEATRRIRALPGGRRFPILALTADDLPEDRARYVAAGMNELIAKPLQPDRLFETMLSWLRTSER